MTNEIFENETTNTALTVDQRNNRFLAIPEDPKELDTFVTIGTKAIEAAQAILKKQRISGEEWRQLHEKTKEQGYIVLEAANKLAIAVREIPTTSGGRPKKESLDEADLSDETISSTETVFSEETISNKETVHDEAIRAKKQVLEEDFGLTEKQAWKIAKLTVEAVDKEKAYAKDNDEVRYLSTPFLLLNQESANLQKQEKTMKFLKVVIGQRKPFCQTVSLTLFMQILPQRQKLQK